MPTPASGRSLQTGQPAYKTSQAQKDANPETNYCGAGGTLNREPAINQA
jgi:hypothetical protein